jgi:trigger factor
MSATPTSNDSTFELKVTTETASAWGRILTIEFERTHFEAEREKVLRDLRRRVTRPGFRKGKVPRELVERDFGARIQADTLEKLLPAICSRAIEQEGLDVISAPSVKSLDLDHPEHVRMDVELDVRPTLRVGPLEQLQVKRWKPEVRAEVVDEALERVRDEQAQFATAEREARDGDFVLVSYVPLDESGKERASQKVDNYSFQLGASQVVAEFESAVRGRSAGDSANAAVHYADDHENKELAGKDVAFVLTLNEVKEKRLPDLDDELARDLGLDDLEALQKRVRDDLEKKLDEESERDVREKLVDAILAAHPFEPPRTMVERYLDAVMEDYDERHRRMQMEPDAGKRDEFRNSARPSAERAVRRMLLVEHLQKEHDLRASEEDVDKWIEDRVQAEDSADSRVRRFFSDPERRRRLRSDLTENKVFEFVKGKAQIEEVARPASP